MGDEEIETANHNYFEGLALKRNEKIRTAVRVGCRGKNDSLSELFFNGRELKVFKNQWRKPRLGRKRVNILCKGETRCYCMEFLKKWERMESKQSWEWL